MGGRLLAPSKAALHLEFPDRRWLNRYQSLMYADRNRHLVQAYVAFRLNIARSVLPSTLSWSGSPPGRSQPNRLVFPPWEFQRPVPELD